MISLLEAQPGTAPLELCVRVCPPRRRTASPRAPRAPLQAPLPPPRPWLLPPPVCAGDQSPNNRFLTGARLPPALHRSSLSAFASRQPADRREMPGAEFEAQPRLDLTFRQDSSSRGIIFHLLPVTGSRRSSKDCGKGRGLSVGEACVLSLGFLK